ncbi:hypothetical protein Tco_1351424 [Tanacetum coccineum]
MKIIGDLVEKDRASSGSNVLYALKSRYCCLSEPLASASRPNNDNGRRNYLTPLFVFGKREVDDDDDDDDDTLPVSKLIMFIQVFFFIANMGVYPD